MTSPAQTDEDENTKYPSGGMPPQRFRVILPNPGSEIVTQRLILKPTTQEHAEGILRMNKKHHGQEDCEISQIRAWIDSKIFSAPENAVGHRFQFSLVRKDEPERIMGIVGMNQVHPLPNIGYAIDPDFWGRGYATEVLEAAMKAWWALPRESGDDDDGTGLVKDRIFANVKDNPASQRVLAKCGFKVYNKKTMADGILCFYSAEEEKI